MSMSKLAVAASLVVAGASLLSHIPSVRSFFASFFKTPKSQDTSSVFSEAAFDRQVRIPEWNQAAVQNQVALCLGVGGLGSSVAMALVRLGFKKIYLVDRDVVELHNLNRQILFSLNDVGKSKVSSAISALHHHNLRTEIVGLELDAVKCWDKIVEAASECNVIFNMIDHGQYFDVAVQSLALSLGIPVISGGTFRYTVNVEFSDPVGQPCWVCITDGLKEDVLDELLPHKIRDYKDISFIPKDENPVGASNVNVACICSHMMVSSFIHFLHKEANNSRTIFYVGENEMIGWKMESNPSCKFCADKKPAAVEVAPVPQNV